MIYQEQLKELVNIYARSQKGDNDESFDSLLMELRKLSNNWHNLKENKELSFPEYTQLIEKKYHLSESIQLRRCNEREPLHKGLFARSLMYAKKRSSEVSGTKWRLRHQIHAIVFLQSSGLVNSLTLFRTDKRRL
jgi:hypothetical protein